MPQLPQDPKFLRDKNTGSPGQWRAAVAEGKLSQRRHEVLKSLRALGSKAEWDRGVGEAQRNSSRRKEA